MTSDSGTAPEPTAAPVQRSAPVRTVRGKWFIPTIFVGFILFTLAMSFGTVILGKVMRPVLERRQIEAQKAEMEREARARQSGETSQNGGARP